MNAQSKKGVVFMELQQLNQRIAVVNGESKRLNSERQILIGRRQTLEKQLSDALAAYKQQYGIELTVENISSEAARVSALKEAEVFGIETMLSLIKAGQYVEAEKMASGVTEAEPESQQEQQETQEQQDVPPFDVGVPPAQPVPAPVQPAPAQSENVIPPSVPPVATPPAPPAAPPVLPTFQKPAEAQVPSSAPTTPPAPPTSAVPPRPAPTTVVQDDTPPAPPPPFKPSKPLGTPKIGVPPEVGASSEAGKMSFQAILSGKAFNPQGSGGTE